MGDFNRDFNRRHYDRPHGPPHQRNSQWGEPEYWEADQYHHPSWRDTRRTDRYQYSHPSWGGQYERSPPNREQYYQREQPPQSYQPNRGNRYDRDYHRFPRQADIVVDPGRERYSNQQQHPTDHHSSEIMGKKKGQSSRSTKALKQETDNTSQEAIPQASDPDVKPPTSKSKPKRSKGKASGDQDKVTISIAEDETDKNKDQEGSDSENNTERTISEACTYLKLDRGSKLLVETSCVAPSKSCGLIPIANPQLTRRTVRFGGSQDNLWDSPIKNSTPTTMVILDPALDETPVFDTRTLAQEFIRSPEKRWLREGDPKLRVGVPYFEKYFIWARMMLLSEEDKNMLDRADVLRGIFGSLFRIPKIWPLLQAFLTFWNVDGHTIVTSQGEMGYSLLLVNDAMGLPISGHAYDEYVPLPCCPDGDEVVKTLHAV